MTIYRVLWHAYTDGGMQAGSLRTFAYDAEHAATQARLALWQSMSQRVQFSKISITDVIPLPENLERAAS